MTDLLLTAWEYIRSNEALQLWLLGALISAAGTAYPPLQKLPIFGLLVALSRRTTLDVSKQKPGGS